MNKIIFCLLLFTTSCSRPLLIEGSWSVIDIKLRNKNIRNTLGTNGLILSRDKSCLMPIIIYKKEYGCQCTYKKVSNDSIVIDYCSPIFSGTFKTHLINGKLHLKNDSIHIIASNSMDPINKITKDIFSKSPR